MALESASTLAVALAGALLGYFALWFVARVYWASRKADGLGLGDAKLFAAAGAWLGPLALAPVLLVASLLALFTVGILRLSGHSLTMQTRIPFGPFISASFFGFWLLRLAGYSFP